MAIVEAPAAQRRRTFRVALGSIALPVLAVAVANLAIWLLGRLVGATFTYTQDGATVEVDAASVLIMSTIPVATGLALAAAIATRWRPMLTVAKVVAPVLAVATIGIMTIPAGFDRTSAVLLSAMHLVVVPGALHALASIGRSLPADT
jgi:hypothetical protein